MVAVSAAEVVCGKAVVYGAVRSVMPKGVGGWKNREVEIFRLSCERVVGSKAPSKRVALLSACRQQQGVRERGWHCASLSPQRPSSSLPACNLSAQVFCFT